jgi:hypothetical protein
MRANRISANVLAPMRPAANFHEALAQRVLAASKPAVVNQAMKSLLKLANRR